MNKIKSKELDRLVLIGLFGMIVSGLCCMFATLTGAHAWGFFFLGVTFIWLLGVYLAGQKRLKLLNTPKV